MFEVYFFNCLFKRMSMQNIKSILIYCCTLFILMMLQNKNKEKKKC